MISRSFFVRSSPALAICLLVLLAGSQPVASEDKIVTIKGEIEAAVYDDDGAIESVAVFDSEWGEVLISNSGKGKQLLDHVGEFVEITGKIAEIEEGDAGFSYEITVTTFTIEKPEDPGDEEDWDPEIPE